MSSATVPINGVTLRYYRKHSSHGGGASQYDFAAKTQLSRSFIADIEAGRRKPRQLAAQSIAEALGVTIEDLCQPV